MNKLRFKLSVERREVGSNVKTFSNKFGCQKIFYNGVHIYNVLAAAPGSVPVQCILSDESSLSVLAPKFFEYFSAMHLAFLGYAWYID